MKILIVVGARPNFIKVAPFIREIEDYNQNSRLAKDRIVYKLVHTGQHYEYEMSGAFFRDLNIPKPDYNLGVGPAFHGQQTGEIMIKFEKVCLREKPNLVVVVGDVNSTLAGALVAAKLHLQGGSGRDGAGIPVAHVEAGLRSGDLTMPEEINRILTDQVSDFLFVTEPAGVKNLLKENISKKKIYLVGNIMIDSLVNLRTKIKKSDILKKLKLQRDNYAVLTLHRPANVDSPKNLQNFLDILSEIQKEIKLVFPVHPRTKKQLKKLTRLHPYGFSNFILTAPLGYVDFLALESRAKFVLTDSGGMQEETTFLKIPCLTLRENTERPITVQEGTNIICGGDKKKIIREVKKILVGKGKKGKAPKQWDGKTAKRIIKIIIGRI